MTFDLPNAVAVLARTPHTLRAMLSGLSPAWIDATEGGDSWSPYTIVGHLLHGERTDWIPRARIILAQGTRTPLRAVRPLRAVPRVAGQVARRAAGPSWPAFDAENVATLLGLGALRSGAEPRGRTSLSSAS
jgi:hypothetical protein